MPVLSGVPAAATCDFHGYRDHTGDGPLNSALGLYQSTTCSGSGLANEYLDKLVQAAATGAVSEIAVRRVTKVTWHHPATGRARVAGRVRQVETAGNTWPRHVADRASWTVARAVDSHAGHPLIQGSAVDASSR